MFSGRTAATVAAHGITRWLLLIGSTFKILDLFCDIVLIILYRTHTFMMESLLRYRHDPLSAEASRVRTAYDDLQLAVALPLQETKLPPSPRCQIQSYSIVVIVSDSGASVRFTCIAEPNFFFSLLPSQTLEGCAIH